MGEKSSEDGISKNLNPTPEASQSTEESIKAQLKQSRGSYYAELRATLTDQQVFTFDGFNWNEMPKNYILVETVEKDGKIYKIITPNGSNWQSGNYTLMHSAVLSLASEDKGRREEILVFNFEACVSPTFQNMVSSVTSRPSAGILFSFQKFSVVNLNFSSIIMKILVQMFKGLDDTGKRDLLGRYTFVNSLQNVFNLPKK